MAVSTAFSLGAYYNDGAYETTARAAAPTTVATKAYDNSVYGINFKADKYAQYDTSKTLQVPPKTITAEIRIPSNAANRTGIILGCYKSNN